MTKVLTVLTRSHQGYLTCVLSPVQVESAWPPDEPEVARKGIVLELSIGSWEIGMPLAGLDEITWPSNVIRNARKVGIELAVDECGMPRMGMLDLNLPKGFFWQLLTVLFLDSVAGVQPLSKWESFRTQVRNSLYPEDWTEQAEVRTLLHIAEGDFAVIVTSSRSVLVRWLAVQLAGIAEVSLIGRSPEIDRFEPTADWVIQAADGRGLRLGSLVADPTDDPKRQFRIRLAGRFGCGRNTLVRGGARTGEPFRMQF